MLPINVEPLLVHALPLLVVTSRIGGLFLTAPLFSSSSIPRQAKVLILLALGVSVYPAVDLSGELPLRLDLYALAPVIVAEIAIGAVIGLMASLPLHAIQLGGLLMGQQMGLGIAQVVNPGSDIEGDSLGQMLYLLAMMSFIIVGGLELVVGATVETFRHVPLGGFRIDADLIGLLTGLLHASLEVSLRIALPIVLIIFLENIVVGFLMRTIPGLNILNFGFPLRILLGVGAVIGALAFIAAVTTADLDHTADAIMGWVDLLGLKHGVSGASGGAHG